MDDKQREAVAGVLDMIEEISGDLSKIQEALNATIDKILKAVKKANRTIKGTD